MWCQHLGNFSESPQLPPPKMLKKPRIKKKKKLDARALQGLFHVVYLL